MTWTGSKYDWLWNVLIKGRIRLCAVHLSPKAIDQENSTLCAWSTKFSFNLVHQAMVFPQRSNMKMLRSSRHVTERPNHKTVSRLLWPRHVGNSPEEAIMFGRVKG